MGYDHSLKIPWLNNKDEIQGGIQRVCDSDIRVLFRRKI